MDLTTMLRKLRRSIASFAVVAIIASLSVASAVSAFSDVKESDWYFTNVQDLVDAGVLDGTKDMFHPADNLNRAEAAKIAVLAAGVAEEDLVNPETPSFSDVPKSLWAYKYIETAKSLGYVSGDAGKKTFRPGDNVNRAEYAKMMSLALELEENLVGGPHFSDVSSSAWYYNVVETAYNWSVVSGYEGGIYKPSAAINRAEMSKMTVAAMDPTARGEEPVVVPPVSTVDCTKTPTDPSCVVAPPVAAGTATIAVASDTPSATILATGTAFNKVLKLNVTAGTDADVSLKGLTITRGGLSANAFISGLGVYDGADVRHGNMSTSWNDNNTMEIDFSSEPIVVAKGTTQAVWVKANLTAAVNTGTIVLTVAKAADVKSSAVTIGGTFPMSSASMDIRDGSTTVAAVTVDSVQVHNNGATDVTSVDVNLGTTRQQLTTFRLANSAVEAVKIKSLTLYNNGSAADGDVTNFVLVGPDGADIAKADKSVNKYITFKDINLDLAKSASSKDLKVYADVVGGSTRTTRLLIQNDFDLVVSGTASGAQILPGLVGGAAPSGNDRAFPVGDFCIAGANYCNKITISAGTLTMSKASDSPTGNVAAGATNVTLAKYEVKASGEDMEIRAISYGILRSVATNLAGTVYIRLKDPVAGTTTTLFSEAGSSANYAAAATETTTFSKLTAGKTYYIEVVGDILSTAAANVTYASINFDITSVKRMNTNDIVDPMVGTSTANTLTVRTGSLTVTANSGAAAVQVVAGQSTLTTLGTWDFSAAAGEGITLTNVVIDDSTVGLGRNFKEMELWIDGVKRSQDTSSTISPSATAGTVTFNISPSFTIAASQTSVVEVKAKVLTSPLDSGSNVTLAIDASGVTGNGSTSQTALATTPALDVNGQQVTLNTAGTLSVSRDTVTNVKASQVVTGSTNVTFAAFKLQTGDVEDIRIKKITVRNIGSSTGGLTSIGVYDGTTLLNDVSTTPGNEGILKASLGSDTSVLGNDPKSVTFDYSASPFVIAKNSSKVLTIKANTGYAATNGQTVLFVVDSIEAEGAGSSARIYVTQTSETASADTVNAYALGEVIASGNGTVGGAFTADCSSGACNGLAVVTTARSGTDSLIANGTFVVGVDGDVTQRLTKLNPVMNNSVILSEVGSTTATYPYAVGDVVVISNDTVANTNAHVVTANVAIGGPITGGANLLVEGITVDTNDRITRIPGGFSETTLAVAETAYNLGDILAVTDISTPANNGLYTVTNAVAVGNDMTAAAVVASQVVQLQSGAALVTGDRVAKMPTQSTEAPSTSAVYSYAVGDVIVVSDAGTAANNGTYVVKTAVAAGADLTAVDALGTGITFVAADRISKLYVKGQDDNLKRLYTTKVNFAWTATSSATLSTGNQVEVARFTLGADAANANNPGASASVSALNFTELSSANLTNFTLNDVTNNVNVATGASASSFGSTPVLGSMSAQTFQQGETRTYKVLADVGTNAGSQTAQFRFNAGTQFAAGSATWSSIGATTVSDITWTALAGDAADTTSTGLVAAATGSDVAAPTIASLVFAGTNNSDLADTDTITITWSEKIDPATINTGLYYGMSVGAAVSPSEGATGDVSMSAGAIVTVVNIATTLVDTQTTAAATTYTPTMYISSASSANTVMVLTMAGASVGVGLITSAEEFADVTGLTTTVKDASGNLQADSAVTASGVL